MEAWLCRVFGHHPSRWLWGKTAFGHPSGWVSEAGVRCSEAQMEGWRSPGRPRPTLPQPRSCCPQLTGRVPQGGSCCLSTGGLKNQATLSHGPALQLAPLECVTVCHSHFLPWSFMNRSPSLLTWLCAQQLAQCLAQTTHPHGMAVLLK